MALLSLDNCLDALVNMVAKNLKCKRVKELQNKVTDYVLSLSLRNAKNVIAWMQETESMSVKNMDPLKKFALLLLPTYFPTISLLICKCDDLELLKHLCEKYGQLDPDDHEKYNDTFPQWKLDYFNEIFDFNIKESESEDTDEETKESNQGPAIAEYLKQNEKKETLSESKKKIEQVVIYCDGGHNLHTKDEAWGSVVDVRGKDLLEIHKGLMSDLETRPEKLPVGTRRIIVSKFNDVKTQQNNGAELLAMLVSLRIADKDHKINIIKGDSDLVIKWWSTGHVSKAKRQTMDPRKIKFIEECGKLRKEFENRGGKIIKIGGGENLADIGFHK